MTEKQASSPQQQDRYKVELRSGLWIFFLLMIFTAGEYVAAVVSPALGWLLIIVALPKAYFVVTEYMHIRKLWQSEEEH